MHLFSLIWFKIHAFMIKYTSPNQLSIEEFKTPFQISLVSTNRWIKLSQLIPWDRFVSVYIRKMNIEFGRKAIDPRIVIGALIIKHKLKLSDEETILTIQENPYMQYFLGLNEYTPDPVFDPSLFVEIRKRMGKKEFDNLNVIIIEEVSEKKDKKQLKKTDKLTGEVKNKGKLQIDATVADQYIKYPTDLDLLNESRQWGEKIIDEIFEKSPIGKKPRTYRRVARKDYLNVAKKKHKEKKEIRKGLKQQLQYLRRDIGYIHDMLDKFDGKEFPLSKKSHRYLFVIQEVYRQQKEMYDEKKNSCDDRIVSLHQPHVRPIVRGKQKSPVEFGSKLGMSLDNGFTRINTFSWEAYNECNDLIDQVEAYKSIHVYYPELVLADQIYATKENRKYLKDRGIRLTAKKTGRPSNQKESYYQRKKREKEFYERNQVEGKFGQGKNGYNLNKIRAKLKGTSESWVSCIILVMNLLKLEQIFWPNFEIANFLIKLKIFYIFG
jgi:IS5 family transposase